MHRAAKLKTRAVTLAAAAAIAVAGIVFASGASAAEKLKHYDSNTKDFWLHPPAD